MPVPLRRFVLTVLCFLLFPSAGQALAASVRRDAAGTISTVLTYDPSSLRVTRHPGGGLEARLQGFGAFAYGNVTWPEASAIFAVPSGLAPDGVEIVGVRSVSPAGFEAGELAGSTLLLPDSDAPPGAWAGSGWMRGTQLVTVRITPLVWDRKTSSARLWTQIEVRLRVRPSSRPSGVWQPERSGTAAARDFRHAIASIVVNPDDVRADAPAAPTRDRLRESSFAGGAFNPLFSPSADGSPVEFVIITNEALSAEFQRLADWRTRTGTPSVVRTVEWIASVYPGIDLAERIRTFIRDAASRWGTEWVLLGGDTDVIPIRIGRTSFFGGENIATDLYYQCLDGNWNANGNQLFGEGLMDDADIVPDVWLSRIPMSTTEGAKTVIDKTFQYERTPPAGGYIPSFLALAEVLEPSTWGQGDTVVYDGGGIAQEAISQLPPGFRVTRMYENYLAAAWNGVAVPEQKEAVIDSINAGYEIVHHVGHGFRNNLSVGIGGQELIREDADAFTNNGKPFLFYGINCNSAAVDFDCIAEHLLANPHGGCFAYVGSTRFDFPGDNGIYQNEFYAYTLKDRMPLAQANALAKLHYVKFPDDDVDTQQRWHQMSILTLGDPLVRIRSAAPLELSVTHPATVTAGTPVPVTVHLSGAPLSGARVTLYRNGDLFATDTTAADGTVLLPCEAGTSGTVSLTATWINAIPFEANLPLAMPGAAPYLAVTGLRIDDSIAGNGDGRLDPGETADLHFRIANTGGATAPNVTLTYASPSDSISILEAATDLGTIAPAAADSTFETHVIRVSAAAFLTGPTDVTGTLVLAWTGGSRTDPVVLHVGGVLLWMSRQIVVDDPGGPGHNGVVAPGELVELHLTVRNRGLSVARDVKARLVTADNRVTLGTALTQVATLAPGADVDLPAPLSFSVSDLLAIPAIDLVIEADGVEQFRRPVDVTPPSTPGTVSGTSRPATILLKWAQVPDADLRGYAVFRSASEEGPFSQVNAITNNPMGYFEDGPLPQFSRHFYQVAAQDASGNLGAPSAVVSFVTSFPSLGNWPHQRLAATPSSPVVCDLNGDGQLEIVFGGEEIYAMHADGSEYLDGDNNSLSLGILTSTGNATFWCTPAVADVDGDGILDIVAAGWNNGLLYVFGPDGHVKAGWPRAICSPGEQPWGSPLVADVDGDDHREIFITGGHWLYGFHSDGSEIRDGDSNPSTVGRFLDIGLGYNYGTPAAADFDHDGKNDIVLGTRSGNVYLMKGDGTIFAGFPKAQGGAVTSSPAIADLDKDGELEFVYAVNGNFEVRALNRNGQSPPGWPVRVNVNQDLDASPTIADINGDTWLDVVMLAGNGTVAAFTGKDGAPLFTPISLALLEGGQFSGARGTPSLGDITGDGVPDIIASTNTGNVYGVSNTGQVLPGFPLKAGDSIEGGALLWDVDGDGHTNLIFSSVDNLVYAYDTPGLFVGNGATTCPWPMFRHDQANTGYVGNVVTTPSAPQLAAFHVTAAADGVTLTWRADGYSGWNVWRSEGAAGAERLTAGPLPGGPGEHRFTDAGAVAGTRYAYALEGIGRDGVAIRFEPVFFDVPALAASRLNLLQNAPNPFREVTTIAFTLPRTAGAASPVPVRLDVYDANGRIVRTLLETPLDAGSHAVRWDGADAAGQTVKAGVYFYRLTAGGRTETKKMIVVR